MSDSSAQTDYYALARRFETFALRETQGYSPLYERFSSGIARDDALLALASQATSQPVPNLFFSAVHFLLLRGATHPLARFYPTISGNSVSQGDPFPAFRAFCLEHSQEIVHLLRTRRVQTNEVRRCAVLLPAFGLVAQYAQGRPLTLLEIGASAGLNLLWDRYGYDYGIGVHYGDGNSPVQLSCTLRGDHQPPIPATFPLVASRSGIDLQPVDVNDQEAVDWLHALIWPEHLVRAERLLKAIAVAQRDPPIVHAGNALDLLPGVMASIPEDTVLCLFHSFTVNQFSLEGRERLRYLQDEYGRSRDLFCVSITAMRTHIPELTLLAYQDGIATERVLAYCSGHADWLEWLQ